MANVKDDDAETLEYADESEYMDEPGERCLECEGDGCERCNGTGDEPPQRKPSYRLNKS